MTKKKSSMTYQKRKIRFDYVSDANTEVQVDQSKFDVYCDPETKRYSSSKLPYTDYASMDDLVKAVIDKHPDYRESTT
jgi:hypothetical protein